MAFTTNARRPSGEIIGVYNIDQSVGPGAQRGNDRVDIMLVQALFRILHFEVNPVAHPPPPGKTGIAVDGILGPSTATFISHWQGRLKARGDLILLDGILDPFRNQAELSHVAHVRYALEFLNIACANECRAQGRNNFSNLLNREDIPKELNSALSRPRRLVALKYENEAFVA